MKTLKIEVAKPKDKTMEAAIASRELEDKTHTETNGGFVVFTIECSPFEAFKLGQIFTHLSNV